jgi:hypothetical protein
MPHDRREERAKFEAKLTAGASLLMLAPRRIGKTWLLRKIRDDMAAQGWLCVYVNVEGKRSEDEFLRELCSEIEKTQDVKGRLIHHVTQRFRQITLEAQGSLQDVIGKIDPRGFLEVLVAALAKEERRTLILIDEIALFILERAEQDRAATFSLLHHLRKLQQGYPKVQWFLTGSVGLDVIARRFTMAGALVDYDPVGLEPFTRDDARAYVEHLQDIDEVARFDFAEGAFERLVEELGWLSPYYLRHIAGLIQPAGVTQAATAADVARAIDRILAPDHRLLFTPWEEHIVKNFETSDMALLRALLDILCEAPDGEQEATIQARLARSVHQAAIRKIKDLLIILSADGYIERYGDRWAFRSGLLRRYWLEYLKQ